jgi:NADPH2:quinone reductase
MFSSLLPILIAFQEENMSMKAVVVPEAGDELEVAEREVPDPEGEQVRIDVEACGMCHSDTFVQQGAMPDIEYPRIPGHEVIGRVDAVGDNVAQFEEGQRVGVGWHGGHCFDCQSCRSGDFMECSHEQMAGLTYDGGYAEYMTAPVEALAEVPSGLDSVEACPLMCAGVTTYNAMRHTDARPGDLVAVQGIGGLGHLALQYANASGFETAAISTTSEKEGLAREMGADHFINSADQNAAEQLEHLGGASVVLATAPNSEAMSSVVGGLGRNGEMVVVAAPSEPMEVSPLQLLTGRRTIRGWPSGTARDSEETLEFSQQESIVPMVETFSLENAGEGYRKMLNNDIRFRSVLDMT